MESLCVFTLLCHKVYKGITTDGQEVAIKVQRPDLLHLVALDVYILRLGVSVSNNSIVLIKHTSHC
jgi:predicted unusual protein kinase regulating ubiquinone biosynthesis (AarF/ABC1/UbiB family)